MHILQSIYLQFLPCSIRTVKRELLLLTKRFREFNQHCYE